MAMVLLCALCQNFVIYSEYSNAFCHHCNLLFVLQAAAILSGQDVTKKKRARSPARPEGSMLQSSLQHAPQTPGLAAEFVVLPPECSAQLHGQLPHLAQVPGMTDQPAQIPAIMSQGLPLQAMYQLPIRSPIRSCDQYCSSQLTPMSFAQPSLSHAGPALSPAEEACLLRLNTKPMSHHSTVSSRQVGTQLPQQLPMQLPESWDPRAVSPAQPSMSHLSPVSSKRVPAQLLTKLPVPSSATSRDPRRPSYCGSTVAATSSNLENSSNPVEGLGHSPQHAQDSELRSPASPTPSALVATFLMPDSPDANSSAVNAGDAITQAASPAGSSSPEINAMSHLPQSRQLSDSPTPFLDALLSDNCGEADIAFANGDTDFDFGQADSDYAVLSEAIQTVGQHAQRAQHDMVSSPQMPPVIAVCQDTLQAQSLLPRAPSSPLYIQTFPPPQAGTASSLQKQFPAFNSSKSVPVALESTGKPFKRRWPESPPYTICRWQLLVMQ